MVLTGVEIRERVADGSITISPFRREQLNPNSYNYRLGGTLRLDGRLGTPETVVSIPEHGYVLAPGRLYLGHTEERIGSETYVTLLMGRSSMGRLGLFLQLAADLGNLGPAHSWTLELYVVQPLRIFAGMRVGQVSFWETRGAMRRYQGRYTDHSQPVGCIDPGLTRMLL